MSETIDVDLLDAVSEAVGGKEKVAPLFAKYYLAKNPKATLHEFGVAMGALGLSGEVAQMSVQVVAKMILQVETTKEKKTVINDVDL